MDDALFLDFDGVICDSVNECYVSSWIAFHDRYRGDSPNATALEDYAQFRRMRPFIRSGRDYVLLQNLIADGIVAESQEQLDAIAERAGREKLATYDSLIYSVRENLVGTLPDVWAALNRPYGETAGALAAAAGNPAVWIVSTKRPAFIQRILESWNIEWMPERIVLPVDSSKVDTIGGIMREQGYSTGTFVDDQPDHLTCTPNEGLTCLLARWAYADRGDRGCPGISLAAFVRLLRDFAV